MPLTRSSTVRMLRIALIAIVIAIIVAYSIWRSLNYARGPEIIITEPASGADIDSATVAIQGRALRIDSLSLNGRDITVDQQGNFNETMIVFPGLNVITLSGQDQFGRTTSKELEVVGLAGFPAPPGAATSTP